MVFHYTLVEWRTVEEVKALCASPLLSDMPTKAAETEFKGRLLALMQGSVKTTIKYAVEASQMLRRSKLEINDTGRQLVDFLKTPTGVCYVKFAIRRY